MDTWREQILRDFQPPLPPLTLVSDPDDLLLDEELLAALQARQVEMVDAGDPVAFRYLYEKKYRERVARRQVFLLIRTRESVEGLPYDLIKQGRRLTFRLSSLFPGLSLPVIRQLDGEARDALYAAYQSQRGMLFSGNRTDDVLTDAQTCDFILRWVYQVAPETLQDEVSLIRFFLSLHLQQRSFPEVLQAHLLRQWEKNPALGRLPLSDWLASPAAFYRDLQTRWEKYLQEKAHKAHSSSLIRDGTATCEGSEEGVYHPAAHPFEHPEVQRLLDNLFLEGKLKPVEGFTPHQLPAWARVGIRYDPLAEERQRLEGMLFAMQSHAHSAARYQDWMKTAFLYGEMKVLSLAHSEAAPLGELLEQMEAAVQQINERFEAWMLQNFSGLKNLPYLPRPVMVHHVPHYLASKHRRRTALLVLDGMSVVQWIQIRQALQQSLPQLVFDEQAVFAWVPTITSISRQALLSGEIPLYFTETLSTTAKEEARWRLFWENQGVLRMHTRYQKGLGFADTPLPEWLENAQNRVIVLVIDAVDRLMHKAIQGQQGLRLELDLWLRQGFLAQLLTKLLQFEYDVYLASDHGNHESQGTGRLREGVLAETRGERVRIYPDVRLRDEMVAAAGGITWPGDGLPDHLHVMLARSGKAFVREGERVVSHGGISLEEVVVPFVRVRQREGS